MCGITQKSCLNRISVPAFVPVKWYKTKLIISMWATLYSWDVWKMCRVLVEVIHYHMCKWYRVCKLQKCISHITEKTLTTLHSCQNKKAVRLLSYFKGHQWIDWHQRNAPAWHLQWIVYNLKLQPQYVNPIQQNYPIAITMSTAFSCLEFKSLCK